MGTTSFKPTLFTLLAMLSACGRNDIFEKPQPASQALPPAPLETSFITVATTIPYNLIQTTINNNIPASQTIGGSGDEPCANVPTVRKGGGILEIPYLTTRQACAGHSWSATLTKAGPVTVGRNGDAMRVAVPIDINGHAGLNGDIASILRLNGKSFSATVRPIVDIKLAVKSDWCPQISATPTQDWVTNAKVEIIGQNCAGIDLGVFGHPRFCAGPVNLDLTSKASQAINGQQEAIKRAAASAVDCTQLRDTVQAHWRPIVIPITATGSSPLFLNIIPQSLAISEVQSTDNGLQLAVRAGVLAHVDAQASNVDPLPLPPLEPLAANSSGLRVVVRATAPYASISQALKTSIVGKSFSTPSPAGEIAVTPEDVDVYASNGKLAVGIKISAKLPGKLLDTQGWVYLTSTPRIAESGTAIEPDDLKYSTVLDNEFWQTVAAVFDEQILQQLQENARIDLQQFIAKSSEALMVNINAATIPGVKITAENPTARLLDVSLDTAALVATAAAEMKFSLVVTDDVAPMAVK